MTPTYDSNSVPFTVLAQEQIVQQGIQVYIYDPANVFGPPLEIINARMEPSVMEQLNDDGAGAFKVNINDPKINPILGGDPSLLNFGMVFRISVNGSMRGCFEITGKNTVIVGEGEEAAKAYSITGKGYGQVKFKHSVVYPQGGLNKISPDTRYFSFASPAGDWYVPAQWSTPYNYSRHDTANSTNPWNIHTPATGAVHAYDTPMPATGTGDSSGWPAAGDHAYWIWGAPPGSTVYNNPASTSPVETPVPQGDVYVRQVINLPDAAHGGYALWDVTCIFTAQDFAWCYIDGQLVATQGSRYPGWQQSVTGKLTVPAGQHVIGIRGKSVYGPHAGILFAAFAQCTQLPGQSVQSPVPPGYTWLSGDGNADQKMQAYPASAPGWTCAEIIKTLLAEAQNTSSTAGWVRGVEGMSNITLNFTDFLDSSGAAWTNILNWQFGVGSNYRDILTQFAQSAVDWAFDPSTLALSMWNQRGVDRTIQNSTQEPVFLRPALNVTEASTDGTAELSNYLLVKSQEGWNEVAGSSPSLATYGRRENFLSTSSEVDATAVAQAQAQLTTAQNPQVTVTVGIVAVPGATPWVDFGVGDWVYAPDDFGTMVRRRVHSITATEDDGGNVVYTCEFDTVLATIEMRIQRWLSSIGGGTLNGSAASSLVYGETNPPLTPSSTGSGAPTASPGGTSIAGSFDALISSPTNGQFLVYNGTDGKWENVSVTIPPAPATPTIVGQSTGTGTGTTASVTLPSGIQAGDYILIVAASTATVSAGPAGYSALASVATTFPTYGFRKIAQGSEASTTVSLTLASSVAYRLAAIVLRGVRNELPGNVVAASGTSLANAILSGEVGTPILRVSVAVFATTAQTITDNMGSAIEGDTTTNPEYGVYADTPGSVTGTASIGGSAVAGSLASFVVTG